MKPDALTASATPRNSVRMTETMGVLELTIAAAFWGFGFIGAMWALESMGPLTITGWRFTVTALVSAGIAFAIPSLRKDLTWDQAKLAFFPGVLLSLTLLIQTWGLRYTTATKSGFLTTLYVLFVPLLESWWLKRTTPRYHWVFVIAALIGVALICDLPSAIHGIVSDVVVSSDLHERERWNIGDWATLLVALLSALQIFWFALIHERIRSSFTFNAWQALWAGIFPLALAILFEDALAPFAATSQALRGLFALTFGSTLIAFALQVRAQKSISPSLASLLYLLESPFAVVFAFFLLDERFTTLTGSGAALILAALGASVVFGKESNEQKA